MYTLYKFHFLNGISEINQFFDDILIIWPAPVYYCISSLRRVTHRWGILECDVWGEPQYYSTASHKPWYKVTETKQPKALYVFLRWNISSVLQRWVKEHYNLLCGRESCLHVGYGKQQRCWIKHTHSVSTLILAPIIKTYTQHLLHFCKSVFVNEWLEPHMAFINSRLRHLLVSGWSCIGALLPILRFPHVHRRIFCRILTTEFVAANLESQINWPKFACRILYMVFLNRSNILEMNSERWI